MDIIDRILNRPELTAKPPVLVEIGASGGTHAAWRRLARYSVCIAFDPDSRDMKTVEEETSGYRMLLVQPAAAVAEPIDEADFYLTRSPYCSSMLPPDARSLADWEFAPLFEVEKKSRVRCVQLSVALKNLEIKQVDWFKSDSQGIDLRLFLSLGEKTTNRVLAAEFEPGIIDAYIGEEKLSSLMAAMDRKEFWMSDMRVLGTMRVPASRAEQWNDRERLLAKTVLPSAPGWAEICYLNTFRGGGEFDQREWMLGWVIATLKQQHGFALDLATRAADRFDDPMFVEMQSESENRIRAAMRQQRVRFFLRNWCQRLSGKIRRMMQTGK